VNILVVMAVDLASFECAVAASPLEEGGKPPRLLFRSIVAAPPDKDRCTTELKNKGALYDGLVFSHDVLRYRHLIESPRAPIKATAAGGIDGRLLPRYLDVFSTNLIPSSSRCIEIWLMKCR